MSLIIDGPNGIGKTTLCNELLKTKAFADYKYVHLTAEDKNSYSYYTALLKNQKLILDRGPLDELVYSSLYGRKPRITLSEVNSIFKTTPCYVLLPLDLQTLITNLTKKGEEESKECDITFITNEYNTFVKFIHKLRNVNIIPYDFSRLLRCLYMVTDK